MSLPLENVAEEAEITNFQQARDKMLAMENGDTVENAEGQESQTEEGVPTETVPENVPGAVQEPVQDPVQEVEQIQNDVSAIMTENQTLKEQLMNLQKVQEQASTATETNIVDEALNPPSLDFENLMYLDDTAKAQAQSKYVQDIAEYTKKMALKEMQPIIDDFNNKRVQTERQATLNTLSAMQEFADIRQLEPQVMSVLSNNKAVQMIDNQEEQIVTAYAFAKGLTVMDKIEPTTDELFSNFEKITDIQDLIEKKRLESLQKGQQVPILSASSGAANVALNIPSKPKTLGEARDLFQKSLN